MAVFEIEGWPLPWYIPDEKTRGPELIRTEKLALDSYHQLVRLKIDLVDQFEYERRRCLNGLRLNQHKMRPEQLAILRQLFQSL